MNNIFGTVDMKWIIISLCVIITGCASTSAPEGWLSTIDSLKNDTRGSWIDIELKNPKEIISGELISFQNDTIMTLAHYNNELVSTNINRVKRFKVAIFDPNLNLLNRYATLGFFSSLSHGFWALLTMPAWIIQGVRANIKYSKNAIKVFNDNTNISFDDLNKFSRYRGPIPETIERKKIRSAELP